MIFAIFILLIIIFILAIRIDIFLKSVDDTIKLYLKVGAIYLSIPHHRLISDLIIKEKNKSRTQRKEDIEKIAKSKNLILNIFSHSSLDRLYIKRITKNSIYKKPILNTLFIILVMQVKGFVHKSFKSVRNDYLVFINDNDYENIDYYVQAHTDIISFIYAWMKTYIEKR